MKGGEAKRVRYNGDSRLWNSIRFLSAITFDFVSIKFCYVFNFVFYLILVPFSSHFVYSLLWKANSFGLCPWLRLRKNFEVSMLICFASLLLISFCAPTIFIGPFTLSDSVNTNLCLCSRLVKGVARFRGWDECCVRACFA